MGALRSLWDVVRTSGRANVYDWIHHHRPRHIGGRRTLDAAQYHTPVRAGGDSVASFAKTLELP